MSRALLLSAALVASAFGCRGQTSHDPPITPLRNMHFQQRYNAQARSAFFGDGRTMRQPPFGTVARGSIIEDDRVALGRELTNDAYVGRVPETVVQEFGGAEAMVHRGQERFGIYCTPCHGRAGDGQGMVFLRTRVTGYIYPQPTNLMEERVRHLPDGQLFATISNGKTNMPSYAAQIPVRDRWAIVSYVRALQLSQSATPTGAAQ